MIRFDEIDDGLREKVVERLPYEDPEPCWPWTGSTNKGYPRLKVRGEWMPAHRIVWVLMNGDLPAGWVVHHECGNKACCNPHHLTGETQGENLAESDGANAATHPLEAVWREAYQRAYGHPAGIDRGVLVRLTKHGGEPGARWAIRAVVEHWPRYCRMAADDFGLWFGDYERSPNKPVTGIFRSPQADDAITAAVQLGRELYREERQRQEQERQRREYEAKAPEREKRRVAQKIENRQRKAEFAKTPLGKVLAAKKAAGGEGENAKGEGEVCTASTPNRMPCARV